MASVGVAQSARAAVQRARSRAVHWAEKNHGPLDRWWWLAPGTIAVALCLSNSPSLLAVGFITIVVIGLAAVGVSGLDRNGGWTTRLSAGVSAYGVILTGLVWGGSAWMAHETNPGGPQALADHAMFLGSEVIIVGGTILLALTVRWSHDAVEMRIRSFTASAGIAGGVALAAMSAGLSVTAGTGAAYGKEGLDYLIAAWAAALGLTLAAAAVLLSRLKVGPGSAVAVDPQLGLAQALDRNTAAIEALVEELRRDQPREEDRQGTPEGRIDQGLYNALGGLVGRVRRRIGR